ncbi:MAG: sulfurtransferase [Thiomargarita sp.]|nr:sulfurtransferase [Thiomargarita sp.]
MLIKEIDSQELAGWLEEEPPPILIDVRTRPEMIQASIPSGKPLPLKILPVCANDIPKDQKVVFYCRTGARSAQACMYMTQKGYDNVYNLHGGIIHWARYGLPIIPMVLE